MREVASLLNEMAHLCVARLMRRSLDSPEVICRHQPFGNFWALSPSKRRLCHRVGRMNVDAASRRVGNRETISGAPDLLAILWDRFLVHAMAHAETDSHVQHKIQKMSEKLEGSRQWEVSFGKV
jgi:hypothetical protein